MADSRDITGKNRKFTGSKGIQLPQGSESERVTELGQLRFNTDTNLAEYYDGVAWKSIDAPPVVTGFSIDGGSIITAGDIDDEAAGDATIVISGSNFDTTSGTVTFEPETSGSTVNTQTITRTSTNSFTVTVTRSEFTEANGPYSLVLTNGSGLAATIGAAITADQDPPNFDTAAGSLGTAYNTLEVTGSQLDASATDPDGDTISYSIASGSLPSGLTIGASTGLITGTPSGNATGTYTFTVEAATNFGNSTRQFSLDIEDPPSGGSISTDGNFRIHTFTSSGTFTNTISNLSVECLVVGGGGAAGGGIGGGGGGAGIINGTVNLSPSSYNVIVAGGGAPAGSPNSNVISDAGGDSSVFGATASGGGGGGNNAINSTDPGANAAGPGGDTTSPQSVFTGQIDSVPSSFVSGTAYGGNSCRQNNTGDYVSVGGAGAGTDGGYSGGEGVQINIDSNNFYWAGGGGGSNYNGGSAISIDGGLGGGGGGAANFNNAPGTGDSSGITTAGSGEGSTDEQGTPSGGNGGTNTGGGGGGGGHSDGPGGAGGSGIVIIRYQI